MYRSVTGEIIWAYGEKEKALLTINTPKYQAAAGRLDKVRVQLDNISAAFDQHGAITAIALDDMTLSMSKSILLTTVSSFRNTGMISEIRNSGPAHLQGKLVREVGTAPVLLKRIRGELVFTSAHNNIPRVAAVMTDGSLKNINGVQSKAGDKMQNIVIPLGTENSPWYWVEF
ncbi:MAG: hypothetical protein A2096_09415 [Spirochaetes bacterium GWF1_41_5]|nr:MAG: hypothetical protein A2096_09415 [Spirochaetes bacterium GWF1_41_5]HBE03781.1 hypothetical protein [Spirochaetia bacterium]